ncbi:MAG: hypothetical protein EA343_17315 [Nodularia sp. (in: Bacteria)]|nr:MAG: hypothetical protein EA343_17315 [Nodularia sp. (in: cyanobacteria)]
MEAYNSVLNNPPDLDNSTDPTLPTIGNNISDASNVGVLVADLIKGLISDQDNDNEGIAVTGLTGNGTWQYSLNGGDTWLNFGAVSETRATVLAASTPLYKGSFGGTPNTQGWFQFGSARYNQDLNLTFPFGGGTQTATNGGTNLVTTPEGFAGYSNYNALTTTLLNNAFPVLNRNQGFTLSFDLKINSESNENDRAGFSVLVVTSDKTKAIELGFWSDEIWAQTEPDDGFTRSETEQASRDTTAELTRYDLTIKGDTYSLFAAGEETPIITGSLRDYTGVDELVFTLPYNPYEQPNFIFLGDRTTNAEADVTLSRVELQTNTRVRFVPDSGFEGDATIDFRAWDGTDGKINATTGVDTSNNDGATSFSSDSETARITVNSTINIIIGTDGNDRLYGTAGDDIIYGGAGDDTIYGGAGNDIIYGGAGNDRLYGGDGNDTLYGGDGNDRLYGGDGDDILYGGAGNDRLYGDAGNDHLYGGPGNNLLYGGPGNDRFYFGDNQEFVSANLGVDTIADFVVGNDKIVLSKATFAVLDSILGENDFMVVERDSAAANSNAAIVYNSGNGRLFYNQNRAGSGFGSGAHFATLSRGLNLTAHDFIIQDTIDLGQPVSNYIPDLG